MTEEEIKDLLNYFKLFYYRDETDYILQEEYEELERIIKKNKIAQQIEEARYQNIKGQISDEEFNNIYESYYKIVKDAFNNQYNNQIKKYHKK